MSAAAGALAAGALAAGAAGTGRAGGPIGAPILSRSRPYILALLSQAPTHQVEFHLPNLFG